MMIYRALIAPLQTAVLVLMGATVVALGVHYVSIAHEAREARQAVCAAELRGLKRDPFVARFVTPSDPCLALQIVRDSP